MKEPGAIKEEMGKPFGRRELFPIIRVGVTSSCKIIFLQLGVPSVDSIYLLLVVLQPGNLSVLLDNLLPLGRDSVDDELV